MERNNESRRYGHYQCRKCWRTWQSAQTWCVRQSNEPIYAQDCNKCREPVYAHRVKALSDAERVIEYSKPHNQAACHRCRNQPYPCSSDQYIGRRHNSRSFMSPHNYLRQETHDHDPIRYNNYGIARNHSNHIPSHTPRDPFADVSDEHRGLKCCLVGCTLFVFTALIFGPDIAVLLVLNDSDCDIVGGSDYVAFNVSIFLEIGAWTHISLMALLFCCCGIAKFMDDCCVITAMCCSCCYWLLFVSWVVVGFFLHSEMTDDNVPDGNQCIPAMYSWCITKAIELGLALCLLLCGCVHALNSDSQ